MMPYSTLQMAYYTRNLINSSKVGYRKKIIPKVQISVAGSAYLQKVIRVHNFEVIAFVRIDIGKYITLQEGNS